MHASKSANLGLSNDVSMKKNDVHHIWVYPTMFRSEKPMISTLGGCPTMFRWKKFNVQHIGGLSNDVSLRKTNVQHIWGCPTMFRRKKTMGSTFGAVQRCSAEKKRCAAHLGISRGW